MEVAEFDLANSSCQIWVSASRRRQLFTVPMQGIAMSTNNKIMDFIWLKIYIWPSGPGKISGVSLRQIRNIILMILHVSSGLIFKSPVLSINVSCILFLLLIQRKSLSNSIIQSKVFANLQHQIHQCQCHLDQDQALFHALLSIDHV
jgi:hypothetical protein